MGRFEKTNGKYLDVKHQIQFRAADLRFEADLKTHLIAYHGVSVKRANTFGKVARLHLLTHAIEAYPEIEDLLWPDGT